MGGAAPAVYRTRSAGGRAVILGPTGKNFAAGMSGGIAYVLDEGNTLYKNLNKELVLMEKLEQRNEIEELRKIIERHVAYTGSKKGQRILDDFAEKLSDVSSIDKAAKFEGRSMTMFLSEKKQEKK